jgi:heme/copper-type cytochrome/quinol oxidase subunit 2
MKDNVDKVLERDANLCQLQNRADALQTGAAQFTTNARDLKRKYWWKNLKMWAILIIVVIVLIIIIIVAVTQSVKSSSNGNSSPTGNTTGRK